MSQTINGQHVNRVLENLYNPVAAELTEVEQLLRKELRSNHPYVDELVQYGCLLGGKRLRPALLLLSAKAAGAVRHDHIVLATVVEMIHTATLVHDDVLDRADMRRHLATVNARWDNEASVLLGDFLFTHAFYLASSLDSALACRLIGQATNIVCEGEIRQKGSRGDYALSETDYFSIIESKTAELCACSCHLGAVYSGAAADAVDRLTAFGRNLGIAFQIIDDLLDVLGEQEVVGKSLGTDLEQHRPTLPLIHTYHSANEDERKLIREAVEDRAAAERHAALWPLFERYEAMQYTRENALRFAMAASDALEPFETNDSVEVLRQLPSFVVNRSW